MFSEKIDQLITVLERQELDVSVSIYYYAFDCLNGDALGCSLVIRAYVIAMSTIDYNTIIKINRTKHLIYFRLQMALCLLNCMPNCLPLICTKMICKWLLKACWPIIFCRHFEKLLTKICESELH